MENLHAAVARSTFASQNPETDMLGGLLEVQMWKNCTPLSREAHLQVKMCKTLAFWSTFGASDVENVDDRRDSRIDR